MSGDQGARLDELNRAALKRHWRGLNDLGRLRDRAEADFLADLRANAESVFGDAPAALAPPRPKRSAGV